MARKPKLKTGERFRDDKQIYEYRYVVNGTRKSIYAPTLKELREKESDIQYDLHDGIVTTEKTLSELVDDLMTLKSARLKESTIDSYKWYVDNVKNSPLGKKKAKSITQSEIQKWCIKKNKEGWSYATVSRHLHNIIRPAFDIAVDDDLLRKNPANFKLDNFVKKDQQQKRALTQKEIDCIFEYMGNMRNKKYLFFRDIFGVALYTGMRMSEILALTVNDIDFAKRQIRVNKQVRNMVDGHFILTSPKSDAGTRTVPITNSSKPYLERLIERSYQFKDFTFEGLSGFICLNNHGDFIMRQSISHQYNSMVKGVQKAHPEIYLEDTTFHCFRHTFCTELCKNNINVKVAQTIMGHSNPQTTMNIYTHTTEDMMAGAWSGLCEL